MLILYNELNLLHKLNSKPHPQRPQRITQIIKSLQLTKYSSFLTNYLKLRQKLKIHDEQVNKVANDEIIKVHGKKYFDFVEGMWCQGISKPEMFINVDTYYTKQTFNSAFQAVKTIILSIELGIIQKQKDFICLVRPPGHHSGMKNQPHGFSFFNNVAIAANYFVSKTKKKAVIIDWDIHHGEGTQNIFYNRNDVLYISLHRFDNGKFFPHIKQSGCDFLGEKQGKGFNLNISWNFPTKSKDQKRLDSQTVRDQEYIYCFQKIIQPILKQFDFEAIFISCGFDCALGDPIGDSLITQKGFKYMSNILKSFKKQVYAVLQGGYNIDALKWGIQAVVEGLNGQHSLQQINNINFQNLNDFAKKDIAIAMEGITKYWKI